MQAIILAAGASRRMGYPKALLEIDGKKGVDRIVQLCQTEGMAHPIVVLGAHADRIRTEAELTGAKIALHPDWERGMTSSIKAGLGHLQEEEWFLIWPVDLPRISAADLHGLVTAVPGKGKTILVPLCGDRKGHPIRMHRSLLEEIRQLGDAEGLHEVVRRDRERIQGVPGAGPEVLKDLDTPEDYGSTPAS